MPLSPIFDESDYLAAELMSVIDVPLFDESQRIKISDIACSLSLEHWISVKELLRNSLLSSAIVVHRAQFEAIVRSIWLLYAAPEDQLSKLTVGLSLESEQAAKNMPQTADMMEALAIKAPRPAFEALSRFKENSWKALNSYAHAGIHPILRHDDGYPHQLIHDALRNSNGLAVISFMQAAALSGQSQLQRKILAVSAKYPSCMPPLQLQLTSDSDS